MVCLVQVNSCAGQYKNLRNLCLHREDFHLDSTWTSFETNHGKSRCDGNGRTAKRLTSHESLKRPFSKQIPTVSSMLKFCEESIKNVTFLIISKNEWKVYSYHSFSSIAGNEIAYKHTSEDETFAGAFCVTGINGEGMMYDANVKD